MVKFRKKPIVIEAEQWFPGKEVEGVIPCVDFEGKPDGAIIRTLEGPLLVSPGNRVRAARGL